jgi:hypothetical protein
MFEKKPKFSYFLLGMFFGALCGGILVYYNSVITNENKISVNLIPQIVKQVIGVINNKSESNSDTLKSNNVNQIDKSIYANEEFVSERNNLSKPNDDAYELLEDSANIDSALGIYPDENINIKKEELIAAKECIIYSLDNILSIKSNKSDSLLAIVSGTKDESKKSIQQKITVELWKSPINYKGYQASKNKIVMYGLTEMEQIKIYSYKNSLLLKYYETVYNIDYSSEFSSYDKVIDASLLNQINKINP